jgi:hypothetical protein
MAGTLTVQNLQGPTTGANANKVILPAGHTLDTSGGTLVPSEGQVLQVLRTNELSSDVTTSSTTPVVVWTKTVTPKATNSTFYVWSSWNTRNPLYMNAQVDGSIVNSATNRGNQGSGFTQEYGDHNQQAFHWYYNNTTGANVTLGENIRSINGSTVAEIWNFGYMFSIIMEIAQ